MHFAGEEDQEDNDDIGFTIYYTGGGVGYVTDSGGGITQYKNGVRKNDWTLRQYVMSICNVNMYCECSVNVL